MKVSYTTPTRVICGHNAVPIMAKRSTRVLSECPMRRIAHSGALRDTRVPLVTTRVQHSLPTSGATQPRRKSHSGTQTILGTCVFGDEQAPIRTTVLLHAHPESLGLERILASTQDAYRIVRTTQAGKLMLGRESGAPIRYPTPRTDSTHEREPSFARILLTWVSIVRDSHATECPIRHA